MLILNGILAQPNNDIKYLWEWKNSKLQNTECNWTLDLQSDDFKYLSLCPEISEFDLVTLRNTKFNKSIGTSQVDTQEDDENIDVDELKLHRTVKSWPLISKSPRLISEINNEENHSLLKWFF